MSWEQLVEEGDGVRLGAASHEPTLADLPMVGICWATVDASRAFHELDGLLGDAEWVTELRDDLLGASVWRRDPRPGCSVVLVSVDGVPAALARRASTPDGSYLSSIGTRPSFRGRGLGGLVTALAVQDAVAAGGPLIHLGVEIDNVRGIRLYERLGFEVLGEPAPDMLLLR